MQKTNVYAMLDLEHTTEYKSRNNRAAGLRTPTASTLFPLQNPGPYKKEAAATRITYTAR